MSNEEAYNQTLDYLYRFVDYSLQKQFRYAPEKFNLQRMQDFLAKLGNPQQDFPTIHIAGTKGKGSVSSLCATVLASAGYRTGLYTSPHLIDYNERIQVNGIPIPHAELVRLVEDMKPAIQTTPEITTFEITTGLAFLYFSRQKVDVAVIEVGLGGRLDATNVIQPVLSVITSLSYDHMNILGNTLTQIATEKAGIIKPGIPVVLAPQREEARQTVEAIAAERTSPLIQIGKDFHYAPVSHTLDEQTLWVWENADQAHMDLYLEAGEAHDWEPTAITIPLLGYHQVENAATAYAALNLFRQRSLPVSEDAILRGFANVKWPGRFEILRKNPPIVIDSAHNRDSAQRLRIALDDYFPDYPVVLVFGASEDKDIDGMISELLPRLRQVVTTQAVHPRAMDPHKLVEIVHQHGRPARAVPQVADAFMEAVRLAGQDALILASGSIFLAAEVRMIWSRLQQENALVGRNA